MNIRNVTLTENMLEEVKRAEAERLDDKRTEANYAPYDVKKPLVKIKLDDCPKLAVKSVSYVKFKNKKDEQEDYVGAHQIEVDKNASISDRAVLMSNAVARLAEGASSAKSGSTLTFSCTWHEGGRSHTLTANIGDSRAMLCRAETVTRLTCEHNLKRDHEQQRLIAQGYIIKKLANGDLDIYKKGKVVARRKGVYLNPYPNDVGGLQCARSLGDSHLHRETRVFSSTPSFSYTCTDLNERSYLLTVSDGVTNYVTDEEACSIFFNADRKLPYEERLQIIAALAVERGSKDNISLAISSLQSEILSGYMRLQFVADGHSGKATASFIEENLAKCFLLAQGDKQLYEACLVKSKFMPRELSYLKNVLDDAKSGALSYKNAIDEINKFIKIEALSKVALEKNSFYYSSFPQSCQENLALFLRGKLTALEVIFSTVARFERDGSFEAHHEDVARFLKSYKQRYIAEDMKGDIAAGMRVIFELVHQNRARNASLTDKVVHVAKRIVN